MRDTESPTARSERRPALRTQIAASIVVVTVGAVLAVGFTSRLALSAAFDEYLAGNMGASNMVGGRRMGRMMLGAAEQTFLATVDQSVLIGAVVAAIVAVAVAIVLAQRFAHPIQQLEEVAEEMAAGARSARVTPAGPAEVASLGEAFNRMADSLEQSELLRRRMVADVAHELRNPIAAARVHAEGMADGMLSVEPARFEAIVGNLVHLSDLVNDLQELSVAEAGGLRYEMVPVDVGRLVRSEAEMFADVAPADTVVTYAGSASSLHAEADERRISQVLRNLLSNAARHTGAGQIVVGVRALADGRIEVSVSDSGEGIPDADLPHVFERFYRADESRAADTGGAGLGLAIVKSIVEDHGGEVYARRSSLGGAEVGFILPSTASAHLSPSTAADMMPPA